MRPSPNNPARPRTVRLDRPRGIALAAAALALAAWCPPLDGAPPDQVAAAQLDPGGTGVTAAIAWEDFLSRHDLVWDRVPHRWELAPFSGNGNVGFLFYQANDDPQNGISIHVGRQDYYDHRLPVDGQQLLWIYRCRLPLGRFRLQSQGEITGVDLRMDLWNAELTGTVRTSQGAYQNLFGFSNKTTRLPGHPFYSPPQGR